MTEGDGAGVDGSAADGERREAVRLADLAHDLRTPLAVIQLNAEHLARVARRDGDGSERHDVLVRRIAGDILRATERMAGMIGAVLAANADDSERFSVELAPLELAAFIRAAVELLAPLAARRGVKLTCEGAPILVRADALRLGEAIDNLITNAIKFTPSGGSVVVSVCADGGDAAVTVRDDGDGIDERDLPRIFERAWRGSRDGGTGLGLFLVKRVVEAHGGAIGVESHVGQGSTFRLTLPRPDGRDERSGA